MLIFLIVYIIISVVSIFIIYMTNNKRKVNKVDITFPILFILIHSLYVIPLPLHCLIASPNNIIEGDVSPLLYDFIDYLPWALLFSSLFNLLFAITFFIAAPKFYNKKLHLKKHSIGLGYWIGLIGFFLVSFALLIKFAHDSGGLIGLILSGYHVTEKFVGHSKYAIAFEWIMILTILLYATAAYKKNKMLNTISVIMIILVLISFLIMGRRAVLVVMGISLIYLYHKLVKPIKAPILMGIIIMGFIGLNIVGLLRGDSYNNITSLADTVSKKFEKESNEGTIDSGFMYTLTTGNFVVPYETFPQIIRTMGKDENFGYGKYTFQSLLLIIPNFLWHDRPLPLSNWYMKKFYGGAAMNEGRQFYILTSFYMDYGPFGIIIWAIILGVIFAWISKLSTIYLSSPIGMSIVAILLGNMLNMQSTDLLGFIVVFTKNTLLPLFLILFFSKLVLTKKRKTYEKNIYNR